MYKQIAEITDSFLKYGEFLNLITHIDGADENKTEEVGLFLFRVYHLLKLQPAGCRINDKVLILFALYLTLTLFSLNVAS